MGASHSQPENYTLDSIINNSQSNSEKYTPKELQYLTQKLEHDNNINREYSATERRLDIIISFHLSCWDYLKFHTGTEILSKKYLQYKAAIEDVENPPSPQNAVVDDDKQRLGRQASCAGKNVLETYVTLDFERLRMRFLEEIANGGYIGDGIRDEHFEILDSMEVSFAWGMMPPLFGACLNGLYNGERYGKKTLQAAKFFIEVKNDHYAQQCNMYSTIIMDILIFNILDFLQWYESPSHDDDEGRLHNIYKVFKRSYDTHAAVSTIIQEETPSSPAHQKMYKALLLVDLHLLSQKISTKSKQQQLKGGRAKKAACSNHLCLQLVKVVITDFLITGELSRGARLWLRENLGGRKEVKGDDDVVLGREDFEGGSSCIMGGGEGAYDEPCLLSNEESGFEVEGEQEQEQESEPKLQGGETPPPPKYDEDLERFRKLPIQEMQMIVREMLGTAIGLHCPSSLARFETEYLGDMAVGKLEDLQEQIDGIEEQRRVLLDVQARIRILEEMGA